MKNTVISRPHLRAVLVLTTLAVALNVIRFFAVGNENYVFMLWNAFLALLPIVPVLLIGIFPRMHRIWVAILFFVWLFFLPNAPYLITDLKHIAATTTPAVWFDALLLFTYSVLGIWVWLWTTGVFAQRVRYKSLFVSGIAVLTAYGIYLGRYIRFNTWDIIARPLEILKTVGQSLIHPLSHEPLLETLGVYTLVLVFFYWAFAPLLAQKLEK